jgi:anti-sigma B factor antagonist
MSLHISKRESEGIVILDLKGPLTLGPDDSELRDGLVALCESGKVNIILNLADVTTIDSTGLGTLVFALARLRKASGKLALLNVNRSHLKLFVLTRMSLAFEFFDDEQDAVNSFFPDRELKDFDVLEFVELEQERQQNHESTHGVSSPRLLK